MLRLWGSWRGDGGRGGYGKTLKWMALCWDSLGCLGLGQDVHSRGVGAARRGVRDARRLLAAQKYSYAELYEGRSLITITV